eukprot:Skav228535  [mRNA]  locus=scaffold1887:158626:158973:+ [translate_table: standard]
MRRECRGLCLLALLGLAQVATGAGPGGESVHYLSPPKGSVSGASAGPSVRVTHPAALFYLHHLRSCAMSAWGASGGQGGPGHAGLDECGGLLRLLCGCFLGCLTALALGFCCWPL